MMMAQGLLGGGRLRRGGSASGYGGWSVDGTAGGLLVMAIDLRCRIEERFNVHGRGE